MTPLAYEATMFRRARGGDETEPPKSAIPQQRASRWRRFAHRMVGSDVHYLKTVIDAGTLPIVFQPIIDLDRRTIAGYEALARFPYPPVQRPPDEWFAIGREAGLGLVLELLAIRNALSRLPTLPLGTYLSVNVSPEALVSEGLFAALIIAPCERIVLELTEHVEVEDYKGFLDALRRVRALGVRLAVDDAGAGFSSLRHIVSLSPDVIKLDKTLVNGIHEDPVRRSLIIALSAFANDVRAVLTAEGVEAEADAEALWEWGIRYAQGRFFADASSDPVNRLDPQRLRFIEP